MKAFVSWSGGKDTSLSCYKAMRNQDVEVTHLLNMVSEDGKHSRTHGVSSGLLKAQAEAMGLPILQRKVTWQGYEDGFKKAVAELKKEEGVEAGIFGDIDLQEHRDWVERVCKETGIKPFFPLWKKQREDIMRDFIDAGFEATVVATVADKMGEEWVGRKIDKRFVEDLKAFGGVDLCGEAGEYHSFVSSGPFFKRAVNVKAGKKVKKDNHWFLELELRRR